MVATLLVILMSLSWPAMNRAAASTRLERTGRSILRALSFAHDRAITERRHYRVLLDGSRHHYTIERENDPVNSPGVFGKITDSFQNACYWPQDISVGDLPQDALLFLPDGSALDGGFTLHNLQGEKLRLRIQGITGRCSFIDAQGG